MKTAIQWKQGYRARIDAIKAHKELEDIRRLDGNLTAANVLKRAKDKSSSLHKQFDWDDGEAANQWRLEQARRLIRSIEVIRLDAPKRPYKAYNVVTVPATASDPKVRKVYQSTEEALADPVMRDEILGNAIRDAISFRRKYAALQELAQVFSEIDRMIANFK
jgi:tRNA A37 N6-isopentenylltransferase MiaA